MAENPEESKNKKDDIENLFDTIRDSFAEDVEKSEGDDKKKAKRSDEEEEKPAEDPFAVSHDPDADLKERLAIEAYGDIANNPDEDVDIEQVEEDIRDDVQDLNQDKSESAPQLSEKIIENPELVRAVVLEDYSDEQLHKEQAEDFLRRRRLFYAVLIGIFLLGAVAIASVFLLVNSAGSQDVPAAEVTVPTKTPYGQGPIPASIELPGGWAFELTKGAVNLDGHWEPFGGEWLEGTEVCKWVALPWSIQLEAVVRTLQEGDEIKLRMTNYDVLTYEVDEILLVGDGLTPEDLNKDVPSIVVLLAHSASDQQWALTGTLKYDE